MGFLRASRVVIASLCCVLGCGELDEKQGGGLDKDQEAAHQVSSLASSGTAIGPARTDGFCRANCAGGGSVSCSGSSCNAVDGEYVVCDGSKTYCPCTASLTCGSGGSVSCSGFGSSCAAVDGEYVVCNGSKTYCPCTATLPCESGGVKTCNNSPGTGPCTILGPLTNKVCGGVQCGTQSPYYCPPLPGNLECF
jgi:hypothetical protein